MRRPRRILVAIVAAALWAGLAPALAQGAPTGPVLRIGVVIPTYTPGRTVSTSLFDLVGQAAEQGAMQAYGDYSSAPEDGGIPIYVSIASAPSVDAAVRAANRLLTVDKVAALVGGLVPGEAQALAGIAHDAKVPFMNIGSSSLAVRAECFPTTFNVEASAGMYMDALVRWYSGPQQGKKRWFIVYYDTATGRAMKDRALMAVKKVPGATVVGSAAVPAGSPYYQPQFEQIKSARADAVLSLLGAVDQITFEGELQSIGPHIAVAAYPDPVSQTRDYLGALNFRAATAGLGDRVATWDTTLTEPAAAKTLNDDYTGRWGQPMDPTAWSAYEAVNILHQSALKAGSIDPARIMAVMSDPSVTFDVAKGPGIGFRTWDHQLRQPLYIIRIDPKATWGRALSMQIAVASVAAEIPPAKGRTQKELDSLGDGPAESTCHL
ncbi:MAG: ABC transporter substrate-binding protein [Deinococcales bacterium]